MSSPCHLHRRRVAGVRCPHRPEHQPGPAGRGRRRGRLRRRRHLRRGQPRRPRRPRPAGPRCRRRCAAGRSPTSAGWSRTTPRRWPGWSPPRSASRTREALGEVREIVDTCDFFLGEGRRLYGQTVPSEMPDKQLFTFRKPVGAVAVITAGNFPVAVPSWYIVPALLAGNTIVWKPAEYSAVVSAAFHELFVRGGGLPDGVFNIVHADGRGDVRRARAVAGRRADRQGRLHRVLRRRAGDRRAHRAASADRLPGARRQEPAGRDPQRRPRSRRGGRPVLRLRHRRSALHLARHRDRARVACTTSSWPSSTPRWRRPRSATRPRTC